MKRKLLQLMEELRAGLEADHDAQKKIRIEKLKINSEILKLKKIVSAKSDYSIKEHEEFNRIADSLASRVEELKKLYEVISLDITAKENKFHALCSKFAEQDGTEIYPFEVQKMLQKASDKDWRIEYIRSYEGNNIGYAFVREDDESYGKQIIANYSLNSSNVDVANSPSRKVVYANLKYDASDVIQAWDWMDFYLYAIVGIWKNEIMKDFFQEFIERDVDFAEQICFVIRENFMKTDEEVFNDIVGK